jgi:transposase
MLMLSFVREFVHETYAGGGRPSVDPVVFFKLQLIMFCEGIRSERLLMRHWEHLPCFSRLHSIEYARR